jgi:hypothetical protein
MFHPTSGFYQLPQVPPLRDSGHFVRSTQREACYGRPQWRPQRRRGCRTESERLYHTTGEISSKCDSLVTGSGRVDILGYSRPLRQTYCWHWRETNHQETVSTRAGPRRRPPSPATEETLLRRGCSGFATAFGTGGARCSILHTPPTGRIFVLDSNPPNVHKSFLGSSLAWDAGNIDELLAS